ncbi:MAG TPA: transcriptional regulator [Pseudomonadota bacterium]|jgi:hypothetical protein|nr:transcriptional regulator [Pseudomonadota bacterium]
MKATIKSQDILLLLKLVSLRRRREKQAKLMSEAASSYEPPSDWRGWFAGDGAVDETDAEASHAGKDADVYSVRALQAATGISKSEVSASLRRCQQLGLTRSEAISPQLGVNTSALVEFIAHGLKYVFPAHALPRTRGIPTAASAPVLSGKLFSPGGAVRVWPDALGNASGDGLVPLHKSVPWAARRDADLYAMLALIDSIRLGDAREALVARNLLAEYLGRPK